jgi:uncharacterized membrane protein
MMTGRTLGLLFAMCFALPFSTTTADAWFKVKNNTSKRASVAFMWHKPNCDGSQSNWAVAGWWNLNPGETKTVYGGDLQKNNRYYYYYAFDEGGAEWSGPYSTCVPTRRFEWCDNTCDTAPDTRAVGFQEVDVGGNNNYTINLQP